MQKYRCQAEGGINPLQPQRKRRGGRSPQSGIILKRQSAPPPADEKRQPAKRQPAKNQPVPAVKGIDGKGGAVGQTVAPAFHAVRRFDGVFQGPCHQYGEDGHAMTKPLEKTAAGGVPPQTALRLTDGLELLPEPRHKAQGHAQYQRKGREYPPAKIQKFIRRHHRLITGEPEQDGHQQHRRRPAVEDALQRQGIPRREIGQYGIPPVVAGGIHHRRQQRHRQRPK